MKLCVNELMWCAREAGFSGDNIAIAGAVAMAESSGDTEAMGRATKVDPAGKTILDNEDLGCWQISTKWHSSKLVFIGANWRDPMANARLAKAVYDEFVRAGKTGWSAWAVVGSKAYERYLPIARQQLGLNHLWPPPTVQPPPELTLTLPEIAVEVTIPTQQGTITQA
jgi:Lysozyme like domain